MKRKRVYDAIRVVPNKEMRIVFCWQDTYEAFVCSGIGCGKKATSNSCVTCRLTWNSVHPFLISNFCDRCANDHCQVRVLIGESAILQGLVCSWCLFSRFRLRDFYRNCTFLFSNVDIDYYLATQEPCGCDRTTLYHLICDKEHNANILTRAKIVTFLCAHRFKRHLSDLNILSKDVARLIAQIVWARRFL
jgi:hypothetical protein